jgi:hypothetical protein
MAPTLTADNSSQFWHCVIAKSDINSVTEPRAGDKVGMRMEMRIDTIAPARIPGQPAAKAADPHRGTVRGRQALHTP